MPENKTKYTGEDVTAFIHTVDNEQKRADSFKLIEMMEKATGQPAKMWGPSIIGFGNYHYKYDSGHEGDAPILGFSPRKSAISLYVFTGRDKHLPLVEKLGKYTMGKVCIYVKKLKDIDENALIDLMNTSVAFMRANYKTD